MFSGALVNLYTSDIEASVRFYRDLLGFEETFRTPAEGIPEHVELRLDAFTLGLGTVDAALRVHGVRAMPGAPAMAVVVWAEDVDAAYARLAASGADVVRAPQDRGNGNRAALVRDPSRTLVEIVSSIG